MEFTRRRLLSAAAATAGAGTLAGCISDGTTTDSESNSGGTASNETIAQSSFFVFGDITRRVAGDVATADLLVPIGQHGHGWEPGPSVREDIRDADLFVHGMTGFQPWVDNIIGDLEADGADVTTVDVSSNIELLLAEGGGHGHDRGTDHVEPHSEDAHDHDGAHDTEDGHAGDHTNGTHTEDGHEGAHEEAHTEAGHGEHDAEHDHGSGMDPHFWMDPLRVKTAVETVRQGLADVDSDNADAYAENAESFRSELDNLHEQIGTTVADASTNVILVAGHNSLQYFGDRYGVEVEALTNVSPDDRPTPRDIERAQAVIETHDLQYICADPLESQQAAEQLVAETEAEEVLPLTAMPGLTAEWEAEDWGYVEVMEHVNLPTLERALDAQ